MSTAQRFRKPESNRDRWRAAQFLHVSFGWILGRRSVRTERASPFFLHQRFRESMGAGCGFLSARLNTNPWTPLFRLGWDLGVRVVLRHAFLIPTPGSHPPVCWSLARIAARRAPDLCPLFGDRRALPIARGLGGFSIPMPDPGFPFLHHLSVFCPPSHSPRSLSFPPNLRCSRKGGRVTAWGSGACGPASRRKLWPTSRTFFPERLSKCVSLGAGVALFPPGPGQHRFPGAFGGVRIWI